MDATLMTRQQDDAVRRLARSYPDGIEVEGDLFDWLTAEGLAVRSWGYRLLPTQRCAVLGFRAAFQTLTARPSWHVDYFAPPLIALWVATGLANVDGDTIRLSGAGLNYVTNPHTRARHEDGDA